MKKDIRIRKGKNKGRKKEIKKSNWYVIIHVHVQRKQKKEKGMKEERKEMLRKGK